MATSKRIAKKASKLLKNSRSFTVREVAGSDLAQARKRTRKRKTRTHASRARRRS
jgi:hypothetical protein